MCDTPDVEARQRRRALLQQTRHHRQRQPLFPRQVQLRQATRPHLPACHVCLCVCACVRAHVRAQARPSVCVRARGMERASEREIKRQPARMCACLCMRTRMRVCARARLCEYACLCVRECVKMSMCFRACVCIPHLRARMHQCPAGCTHCDLGQPLEAVERREARRFRQPRPQQRVPGVPDAASTAGEIEEGGSGREGEGRERRGVRYAHIHKQLFRERGGRREE
jgi:hypothetical protein